MADPIIPQHFKDKTTLLTAGEVQKPTHWQDDIPLSGLQPGAGKVVRISPLFGTAGKIRITKLDIYWDDGVQQGTDTTAEIFGQSDNASKMAIATAVGAAGAATDVINLQEQKATGSTPGDKLKYRTFSAFYIGIKYTTAKAGAIAANKKARVVMQYVAV